MSREAPNRVRVTSPLHEPFRRSSNPLAEILMVGLLMLPVLVIGWLPIWRAEDGQLLVALVSAPLFMGCGLAALRIVRRASEHHTPLVFFIICGAYLLALPIRSYYFLFRPDVVIYPNFSPANDMLYLHHGLLLAAVGIWAMSTGYVWKSSRSAREHRPFSETHAARLDRILSLMSSRRFFAILYALGWIGRLSSLRNGSALWFYNSPSFDVTYTRSTSGLSGPLSAIAELCPLAFAGFLASQHSEPRLLTRALAWMLFAVEVWYYTFSMFKFGLLGVVLIPFAVSVVQKKKVSWKLAPVVLIFGVLIVPIVNSARGEMIGYYKTSYMPSLAWFSVLKDSAPYRVSDSNGTSLLDRSDPFFERMNLAESVAVAEKYLPDEGHEIGRSYVNVLSLLVPRLLRFWFSGPYYINWAVNYVGVAPSNLTVFPLPTLVEAYLNFDVPGVVIVMFAMGLLYRLVDSLTEYSAEHRILLALAIYLAWRLLDVEQSVFIVLPTVTKVVALVFVIGFIYSLFAKRENPYPKHALLNELNLGRTLK